MEGFPSNKPVRPGGSMLPVADRQRPGQVSGSGSGMTPKDGDHPPRLPAYQRDERVARGQGARDTDPEGPAGAEWQRRSGPRTPEKGSDQEVLEESDQVSRWGEQVDVPG